MKVKNKRVHDKWKKCVNKRIAVVAFLLKHEYKLPWCKFLGCFFIGPTAWVTRILENLTLCQWECFSWHHRFRQNDDEWSDLLLLTMGVLREMHEKVCFDKPLHDNRHAHYLSERQKTKTKAYVTYFIHHFWEPHLPI